jgi:protein involved in polysaccharide export with SLBB domain
MKKIVTTNNWIKRFVMARWVMPLAALFLITGCETNRPANLHTTSASRSNAVDQAKPADQTNSVDVTPPAQPAQSDSIILREGDVVHLAFPSSPTLDTTQEIRRDGKITLQLIGEVAAAGKTPDELQADLLKLYAPQVAMTQILVTVQSSTFPVYVTGAVLRPGDIKVDHPMSVLEAIMEAGGFSANANLKSVVIIRQGKDGTTRFTVNLKKAMAGEPGTPFYVKPADIIYVGEKFTWF